jgi:hypothetical protein
LRDKGIFRTRRNDAAAIEQVIVGIPRKPSITSWTVAN